ncbi:hypothetical protein GCM10009430_10300 [Aquimarina litoralis]|uniref:Uncharacterized protein n=1 Tax=Aquimarina litoralis TaxID=584605 RepID=A0ABP3TQ91_9FLAO
MDLASFFLQEKTKINNKKSDKIRERRISKGLSCLYKSKINFYVLYKNQTVIHELTKKHILPKP